MLERGASKFLLAIGLLALAGCAVTPMTWFRPGVSQLQMQEEAAECGRLAEQQAYRESWAYGYGGTWGPWGATRPYDRFSRRRDPFWGHNTMFDRMNREQSLRDFCMRSRGYDLVPAK